MANHDEAASALQSSSDVPQAQGQLAQQHITVTNRQLNITPFKTVCTSLKSNSFGKAFASKLRSGRDTKRSDQVESNLYANIDNYTTAYMSLEEFCLSNSDF